MKITDVKTWVVGNPPPGIGGKYFIFVKLTTDGGVVGYGEAYNATFSAHVTAKLVDGYAFIIVGALSGAVAGAFLDDAA